VLVEFCCFSSILRKSGGTKMGSSDHLGEHNEEVLRKLLSLTDQEIAGLYADKVIVRESAAPQ